MNDHIIHEKNEGGKGHHIILADPPWSYSKRVGKGLAEKHYTSMTDEEIYSLPVHQICAYFPWCILLLWITLPKIREGFETMRRWGFAYKTGMFTWIKTTKNGEKVIASCGHYTRPSTELCIIGVRGNTTKGLKMLKDYNMRRDVMQVIMSPRRQHSRKPPEVKERLADFFGEYYDSMKKIELFARTTQPGWDVWGNDTQHFEQA